MRLGSAAFRLFPACSIKGENDMPTTTLQPPKAPHQTHDERLDSKISAYTTAHELNRRAKSMKAIVQDQYGSADVLHLRDVDKPEVGVDDVLLRVHAAGVHIGDWHLMSGEPYLMRVIGFGFRGPKVRVRGMDVAGTVEAVGQNVTRFQAGDEVFGTCDGAFAEYATAREDMLALKPTNLTFEQAAAVPTSAFTALQALRTGGIQPRQGVLVVGASGGVGMFAVQIAKSFGAEVTGVCSTAKVDMVCAVGADHVIDYTKEDFTRTGQQYDLILDMGGNRSLSQLRRALTPHGTLVLVGGEGGDRWIGIGRSLQALLVSPFVSHNLRPLSSKLNQADLQFLKGLIDAGKVTPVIDRTYALSEVSSAIRYLHEGRARGKLVITVHGANGGSAGKTSIGTEPALTTA
jgi:NADPH:quinone reductase-like Zn-dependent oxidoreductase